MSRSRTTMIERHRATFSGFEPNDLMVLLPTERPPTHPGELLREEFLPDLGWSAAELAHRLRVPIARVEAVLAEKASVTPDLALRLGRLFSQTPAFWIEAQLACDWFVALNAAASDLAEIVPLETEAEPVRKAS